MMQAARTPAAGMQWGQGSGSMPLDMSNTDTSAAWLP